LVIYRNVQIGENMIRKADIPSLWSHDDGRNFKIESNDLYRLGLFDIVIRIAAYPFAGGIPQSSFGQLSDSDPGVSSRAGTHDNIPLG
jgi:hypothetical protein